MNNDNKTIESNFNTNIVNQCKTVSENKNLSSVENIENNVDNVSVTLAKDFVAAAGFNVEAPIVNAIIGNITGSLPTKKIETLDIMKCTICDCEITSSHLLAHHINGSKHKKKVKALDIIAQLKEKKGVRAENSDDPNAFRCEICAVTVNSAQQLELHLMGSKHKKKIDKDTFKLTGKKKEENLDHASSPKKKKKEEPHPILPCQLCGMFMNSPSQYEQHMSSKKHKMKSGQSNTPNNDCCNSINDKYMYDRVDVTQHVSTSFDNGYQALSRSGYKYQNYENKYRGPSNYYNNVNQYSPNYYIETKTEGSQPYYNNYHRFLKNSSYKIQYPNNGNENTSI